MRRARPGGRAAATNAARAPRPWYELNLMADPILDQTLLFYLGQSWQNMTDIGECLATAATVDAADPVQLVAGLARDGRAAARAWPRTAATAGTRSAPARPGCARPPTTPRRCTASPIRARPRCAPGPPPPSPASARRSRDSTCRSSPRRYPYEGTTLPGWFFRAADAAEPAPTLIVQQGRDGWSEHCLDIAMAAVKRGYNCLLFEGPGQGKVLRLQGLPFRPDWENVVTPVVDWVVARNDVDPARLGLVGLSMGGALVPRAAAFE